LAHPVTEIFVFWVSTAPFCPVMLVGMIKRFGLGL
jgi:hypothetical protein